ncbi:MAG: SRPBCC domain-containing protein [Mycobacteriales bacterium]
MTVTHCTFTLERTFAAPPARVFAAWSDPVARQRWFAGSGDYQQEFRVGGTERVQARVDTGEVLVFESRFHDIVSDERIMYTSTMMSDGNLSTVSATTVEFAPAEDGTALVITEHGSYLPGMEQRRGASRAPATSSKR